MDSPSVHISDRARRILAVLASAFCLAMAFGANAQVEPFVGKYSGAAEVYSADGSKENRDLSVEIAKTDAGFSVAWVTITFKRSGRVDEKAYKFDFVPRQNGLFAAAQKKDLFGNDVQLDPMKGEPYVWSQINGDTLTVYALFVDPVGGYVIQQYDRTLVEGGLMLEFNSVADGETYHTVSSFLKAD